MRFSISNDFDFHSRHRVQNHQALVMARFSHIALCAVALLIAVHTVVAADPAASTSKSEQHELSANDWPAFLGPLGSGVAGGAGTVEPWPEAGPPIVWSKRIGTGYSAPSVRGAKLVIHHRVKDAEIVECLSAQTGEPIWKFEYPTEFRDPYGYNNGPRCSPLLTDKRCYTFGAEGKLVCLDLESGK